MDNINSEIVNFLFTQDVNCVFKCFLTSLVSLLLACSAGIFLEFPVFNVRTGLNCSISSFYLVSGSLSGT